MLRGVSLTLRGRKYWTECMANIFGNKIQEEFYQELKVEGHLKVCGNSEFQIFPFFQMRSQDTNLRRSYETRFQQKSKSNLNKL